jgi:hypothetical protein
MPLRVIRRNILLALGFLLLAHSGVQACSMRYMIHEFNFAMNSETLSQVDRNKLYEKLDVVFEPGNWFEYALIVAFSDQQRKVPDDLKHIGVRRTEYLKQLILQTGARKQHPAAIYTDQHPLRSSRIYSETADARNLVYVEIRWFKSGDCGRPGNPRNP